MKPKKLVLAAALCLVALYGNLSDTIQEVQAENSSASHNTVYDIAIEVNSTDAFDQIKKALIQSDLLANEGLSSSAVDLEKSDFILEQIDTTKVGVQDINALINLKPISDPSRLPIKSTIATKIQLHVVDTQDPQITLTRNTAYVQMNSEFNPWDYISYIFDNSNQDLYTTLEIQNNVDVNTIGEYPVVYVATDSSGNQTTATLDVNVHKNIISNYDPGSMDSIEAMLTLINNVRAEHGLHPLQLADSAGQTAIAIRAAEAEQNISHVRPDGSHYKTALTDQGVTWSNSPLEILTTAGYTVESKLNWWLNSNNHRAILLSGGNYNTIAIGYSGKVWAAIVY